MLSHYYFYSSVRYIQQQKRESTNVVCFHGSTSTVVKQTLTCYFLFFKPYKGPMYAKEHKSAARIAQLSRYA